MNVLIEMLERVQERLDELDVLLQERSDLQELEADLQKKIAAARSAGTLRTAPPARRARRTREHATGRSASPRKGRAADGRGPSKAERAVELVGRNPGIRAPEVAAALGSSTNYAYKLRRILEQEGRITTDQHGGWIPAGTSRN